MDPQPTIDLDAIRATAKLIAPHVRRTPVFDWDGEPLAGLLGPETRVRLKLELLQRTGTFKLRGALSVMLNADPQTLRNGIAAFSAGNHAIAAACAAKMLGVSATVVMMRGANPLRIARCREQGAKIVLAENVHEAFATVQHIAETEGRLFVHPFDGPYTALGTATLGLEICEQMPDLEMLIVPIGGGGLCGGVASAVRLALPHCEVIGVEPYGADNMYRSFEAGSPQANDAIRTIADSLGPPASLPFSYGLCRAGVSRIVRIEDDEMRAAMRLLFEDLKLAVEPAGAAATAALLGPLREPARGRRVGVLVCGTNIDVAGFARHLEPADSTT